MSEREELLRQIAAGDIGPDDPAVAELSARDPSLRQEVAELLELVAAIDSAGSQARADKQVAAQLRLQDRQALVERAIRTLVADGSPAASPSGTRARWTRRAWIARVAILAAAAVLALVVWRPWSRPGGDRSPRFLGEAGLTLVAPIGAVEAFEEFRWKVGDSRASWFEIAVYGDRGELYRERDLRETRWRPPPAELARWPDEIRWQVIAYDPSGNAVGMAEEHARR
jgi:hypothetical protein